MLQHITFEGGHPLFANPFISHQPFAEGRNRIGFEPGFNFFFSAVCARVIALVTAAPVRQTFDQGWAAARPYTRIQRL